LFAIVQVFMDTLSDVLSLLQPRNFMFRGLDAGAPWCLQFPAAEGVRCYAVLRGECCLAVEGVGEPVRLDSGDCVLLTRRQGFRMGSDMTLRPCDGLEVLGATSEGGMAIWNGGGSFTGIGGYYKFADKHAGVLLGLLPPIVHLRNKSERAALRASMELMMQELREPQPGGSLVAQHLAHLMLIFALRLHLAADNGTGVGWLFALTDKQMAAAINAMHDDPGQPWRLQALAQRACMSRSTFAQKFREKVGISPMEYLVRWRMLLAGNKLRSSGESVADIALSLGYESESAFRTAFKRVMGCSPRQYALRARHRINLDADERAAGRSGWS
jgi:AraC-like DNA-binding protein